MNSSKLLKVVSRLPQRRFVSSIRPKTESVIYNGQTYQKMLHPYTWTAKVVNRDWNLYWTHFHWFRMLTYSFAIVFPIAFYVNVKVYIELWKAKRAEKKHGGGHH